MCRFLVYKGSTPILLSSLILTPTHSILTQSYDSRLRLDHRRPHNGDGFGIGYYTTDPALGAEPCVFKSTLPAWNSTNLERLARKTHSSLVFAHVRASTEGELCEPNCHPFWCGPLMWMHNGGIGAWSAVKRALALSVAPRWFNFVRGGTDSEWAFAVFLDCLERRGVEPLDERLGEVGFGHLVLRKAMEDTIARINRLIAEISVEEREKPGFDARSLLNFAVTDGHSVVCTRYVNSRTDEAASLFWSSGTCWRELGEAPDGKKHFRMERKEKGADIVLVASEPLTYDRNSWVIVPTNSILTISKQTVTIHPIKDEFYSHDPSEERSLKFAQTKGQTVTNSQKEVITGNIEQESPKPQIHLNLPVHTRPVATA